MFSFSIALESLTPTVTTEAHTTHNSQEAMPDLNTIHQWSVIIIIQTCQWLFEVDGCIQTTIKQQRGLLDLTCVGTLKYCVAYVCVRVA